MVSNGVNFDIIKLCAYAGVGAGLCGELLAGTKIYGVVLIPTGATFLTCAGVVAGLMVASTVFSLALGKLFKEKYNTEAAACYGAATFYTLVQVSILTGLEPFQALTLIVIGSLFRRICEKIQKDLIYPNCNDTLYKSLKYLLPQTHINRPIEA